ncbi:hypothetical protein [Brevibacterium aurantiacum]|nr:hypothetical protein [Brevibacterium aurantiacum]
MRVVTHRASKRPPGMEVGEVESACEFPGLDGTTVGDGIAFEETGFVFDV